MSTNKKDIIGITRPIYCKKCNHRVGFLKLKPALLELLDKKNRKETWSYIFGIALITQIISQIISDLLLGHYGWK